MAAVMLDQEMIVNKIEIEEAIVGLRKDGIVHVFYCAHTEITVELQLKMREIFNEITGRKKSLFIFQAGENCTVGKEAREHAIQTEHLTPTLATVVYVTSLAHKIIAEFYYKFNKPVQPYKVVSEFSDGIQWLLDVAKEIDEGHGK